MVKIKNFKGFITENNKNEVNEGLSSMIKKIPGVKKYYDQIQDVISKVGDKAKDYIQDNIDKLSDEDINKINNFKLDNMVDIKVPVNENENKKEKELSKTKIIDKVLNILGISAGTTGLLSGIYSMIIGAIEQSGYAATPWFVTCVILFIITGVSTALKSEGDEKNKK